MSFGAPHSTHLTSYDNLTLPTTKSGFLVEAAFCSRKKKLVGCTLGLVAALAALAAISAMVTTRAIAGVRRLGAWSTQVRLTALTGTGSATLIGIGVGLHFVEVVVAAAIVATVAADSGYNAIRGASFRLAIGRKTAVAGTGAVVMLQI